MEAAKPISPTIQDSIILKMLKEDNNPEKNYTLKIQFLPLSITIRIIEENNLQKTEYSNEFTLEDLQNNGKFFKICENIEAVKSSLEESFKIKKPVLKVKENFIELRIVPVISALSESVLLITKIKPNKKEQISLLSNIINHQQNEINNLNEKINNHEIRIKKLELIIEKLDENEHFCSDILKSDIINCKEQIKLLNQWINKKNNNFTLIYKGSRDGDSYINFHEKCDNQGPTIMIIKSSNGEIFGGYTEKSWVKGKDIHSPESFLFNLNKKEKYFISGEGYILSCEGQIGFGDMNDYELSFYDNYFKQKSIISGDSSYNFSSYEISGGNNCFIIKEMEVYKISQN